MIPTRRPASRFALPISALVAIAIVPGLFLLLAWSSVANQLEAMTQQESAPNTATGAARHWNFDQTDALVVAGSIGLARARFGTAGLSLTLTDGEADLSLHMQMRPIALTALDSAVLSFSGDAPVSVQLIAHTRDGIERVGSVSRAIAISHGRIRLEIPQAPPDQSAMSLRLHISADPGVSLQLHSLALLPVDTPRVGECVAQVSVAATLRHCGIGPGIIRLPGLLIPERLLAFADQLRARSLATVQVRGSSYAMQALLDIRASRWFAPTVTGLALLVGVLLIGTRFARRNEPPRQTSPWGLGVLLAAVALLWLGIPGAPPDADALPLAAWFAVLLLLPAPKGSWEWLGQKTAWRASLLFSLFGLLVIAVLAVFNALDQGAYVVRAADLDKLWIYPLWATFQQYVLIAVIGPRTRASFTSIVTAAICAGAIFGLLHLPNFSLMLFTFAAGSAWAWQGFRHRALLPLIISHALLGAMLMLFAPTWLMRSAEIGGRFLMPP